MIQGVFPVQLISSNHALLWLFSNQIFDCIPPALCAHLAVGNWQVLSVNKQENQSYVFFKPFRFFFRYLCG